MIAKIAEPADRDQELDQVLDHGWASSGDGAYVVLSARLPQWFSRRLAKSQNAVDGEGSHCMVGRDAGPARVAGPYSAMLLAGRLTL